MPREIRDQIFGYLLPPLAENSIAFDAFPTSTARRDQILPEYYVELLIQGLKFNPL